MFKIKYHISIMLLYRFFCILFVSALAMLTMDARVLHALGKCSTLSYIPIWYHLDNVFLTGRR